MKVGAPLPVVLRSLTIEKLSIPLAVLVFVITFGFGNFPLVGTESILPITTFLYGLLITFMLSDRYKRYESIHDLHSKEASDLISLYLMAKLIGKDFSEKIRSALDEYIVSSQDYFIEDSVEYTSEQFYKIFNIIEKDYSKMKSSKAGESVIELFENVSEIRKELNVDLHDKLTIINWVIIAALVVVMITSLQSIKTESFAFNFMIFLFTFVTFLTPLLVRDLDNLMWGGYARGAELEIYGRVLERMGLMRYYPETILGKLVKPPKGKDYRVGIYLKKYPDNTKKIKIVRAGR